MKSNQSILWTASCLGALATACGGAGEPADDPFLPGFSPPAALEGFTRFITPPVRDIQPGADEMWCQWVTGALPEETDVVDIRGFQTVGGHHAIMYATNAIAPVGTTRPCRDSDLTSIRYLGGVGGEGVTGEAGKLPDGIVYRVPAGMALMANVHYQNYRASKIDAQSVLDIHLAPVDLQRRVAQIFVNIDVDVDLPAGRSNLVTECTLQEDMNFIWFGNHMHKYGAYSKSELIRANGTTEMLREDQTWDPQNAFAPTFTRYPVETPLQVRRGDRIRTECRWDNTSGNSVVFPSEMCAGFGFFLSNSPQINCIKGEWTY